MQTIYKRRNVKFLIEIVFDIFYLITACIITLCLFLGTTKIGVSLKFDFFELNLLNKTPRFLWALLSFVLVFGDSFHLLPRIFSLLKNDKNSFEKQLGIGKQITSITMTVFYVILWQSFQSIINQTFLLETIFIYFLALIRIFLCLLKQNNWEKGGNDGAITIWRNIPFCILGAFIVFFFFQKGRYFSNMFFTLLCILISFSFICYLPVVLFSKNNPKIAMLMLPKSIAYLCILFIGLNL